MTYTYDSNMRLSTVTDAKNQQKVMTYDSLSRVTQVQRYFYSGGAYVEDPSKRTNFYYDSNPFGDIRKRSGTAGDGSVLRGSLYYLYSFGIVARLRLDCRRRIATTRRAPGFPRRSKWRAVESGHAHGRLDLR